jgi:aerobic carbon-monoxide dehydrogenase small subunit
LSGTVTVRLQVNGIQHELQIPPHATLASILREVLGLTGTHLGCEEGTCGSCTVLVGARTLRSCLTLAVQMQNASITTAEGYQEQPHLRAIQSAFIEHFAAQCGFCTSGMMAVVAEYLQESGVETPGDERTIRERLDTIVCRCTGYQPVVEAVKSLTKARTGE